MAVGSPSFNPPSAAFEERPRRRIGLAHHGYSRWV
jgi:hypothetical protein